MKKPTDPEIKEMLFDLLQEIDYDIYKSYKPETSEDPDEMSDRMDYLVDVVKNHLEL